MRKIIISDYTYEQICAMQSGEGDDGLIARDHVAESYFGKVGNRKSTEKTRNRLYWMASQIVGTDVLDVGCSEGVLSILAAREGYSVTGIDLNSDAIQYARDLADQESAEVRERVDFKIVDLASVGDGKPVFDTVLAGEVIEHVLAPERLMQLCATVLKPDGVLVITTPFGISSNYDHKQTFFPGDLVALAKGLLSVEHLSVDDGYIRFVGRKSAKESIFPVDKLLSVTEAGTFAAQNAAQEIMDDRRKRIARSQREADKAEENLKAARKKQKTLEEHLEGLSAEIAQLKSDAANEQAALARAIEDAKRARKEAEDLRAETAEKVELLESELDTAHKDGRLLKGLLDELKVSEAEAREQIAALKRQAAADKDGFSHAVELAEKAMAEQSLLKKDLADVAARAEEYRYQADDTKAYCENTISYLDAQSEDLEKLQRLSAAARQSKMIVPVVGKADQNALVLDEKGIRYRIPVDGGATFAIGITFTDNPPLEKQDALAKFEYRTADLQPLAPPYQDTMQSSVVGAYRYLAPQDIEEGVWTADVVAPDAATTLDLTVRTWKAEEGRAPHIRPAIEIAKIDAAEVLITKLLAQSRNRAKALRTGLAKAGRRSARQQGKARPEPKELTPRIVKPRIAEPNPDPDALRLLTLLDEFSEKAFEHDAHITRLSLRGWEDQIEKGDFDAFLAESVWRGNGGEWSYAMSNTKNERHAILKAVIAACRERGIPTIIWNKEDPPNFDVFKDSAILFDHIFTSDVNCVEDYKELVGHDSVHALPFFAQPKLHNPIGKSETDDQQIVFAGSWYAEKHQDRSAYAPLLFDAASENAFTIYNRHSEEKKGAEKYRFPDKYQKFVKPKVSYDEMLGVHKSYQVFLNVNSVTQSDTMFARRIFEVLACSTPIVSTASTGLEKMFGDIVPVVHDAEQAQTALADLLEDCNYRYRVGHLGYRRVMTEHTAQDRIRQIAETCGLRHKEKAPEPMVSWISATNRKHYIDNIVRNYLRQTHSNMELIIVLNSDEFDLADVEKQVADVPRCRVLQLPESAFLGDCLNAAIEIMEGDYFFKIDDDDVYFENYTSDMLLPFKYTEARIVGKQSVFSYIEAQDALYQRFQHRVHRYSKLIAGPTLVADRRVVETIPFGQFKVGTDTQWIRACLDKDEKVYSTDPYNFVLIRRSDPSGHTWGASVEQVIKNAVKIADGFAENYVRI